MSKDIIFTTETDGLVRHQVVSDKYIHLFPNMLEFTAKIPGEEVYLQIYINNQVDVPDKISVINGITKDLIEERGITPVGAANLILAFIEEGDCLVSHNVSFHIRVFKAFFHRLGMQLPELSTKCLQTDGTEVCAIPFKEDDPKSNFKKPTLGEMKSHFGIEETTSKIESLLVVYNNMRDILNEERPVKPASF
tara:strand:- start:3559 stop:4137 length:579 start_codon:yes stop_codon:yes gene_type:complete